MDFENAKELITWVAGLAATTLVSLAIGIFNIIKSGKMMPKDIKKADLENKSKEISIAEQYDELATKAAEKVLRMQERLDKIEKESGTMQGDFETMREEYRVLKEKVEAQECIIKKQAIIIEEQSKRLDMQDTKIKEQQDEIVLLQGKLEKSEKTNQELLKEIQKNGNGITSASPITTKELKTRKSKKEL